MPSNNAHAPSLPVVGRIVLTVHDLDGVGDFYQRTIGLPRLEGDGEGLLLGRGQDVQLELRRDRSARLRSPREAGLFHTAFLLPGRVDLGAWLTQAAAVGETLTGAADHAVSEAVYLNDPEGNGIEIYADRPASTWNWQDGLVAMSNARLDVSGLIASAAGRPWRGAPEGTTIGHVHLQVGALDRAEDFYHAALGLDVTCRYPGALFYSVDGYHHHIGTNAWNSPNAGRRNMPSTGLAELELRLPKPSVGVVSDPWGTPIKIV